jgi:chromosome segregation ATPase
VQAQAPVDTQQGETSEEHKMVTVLKSMRDEQEKMMKEMVGEQRRLANAMGKMSEEQKRMAGTIDKMSSALQNLKLEMGELKADIKSKGQEHMQLTEENKKLNSQIKEQGKQIDAAYLEIEEMLKSKEVDQKKNEILTQKYKELQKAKEKIDNDHKNTLENVRAFETKFSELMGKEISFEKALTHLEIHLRKEQRSKAFLVKELEEKTEMTQNVEQLRKEIENLKTQEEELRRNKEEMGRKMQNLTKANNGLKLQYEILQAKYNRGDDNVANYKRY